MTSCNDCYPFYTTTFIIIISTLNRCGVLSVTVGCNDVSLGGGWQFNTHVVVLHSNRSYTSLDHAETTSNTCSCQFTPRYSSDEMCSNENGSSGSSPLETLLRAFCHPEHNLSDTMSHGVL